jgi:hypothetical protein
VEGFTTAPLPNLVGIEMWSELSAFRPSLRDNSATRAFTVKTGLLVQTRFFEIGGTVATAEESGNPVPVGAVTTILRPRHRQPKSRRQPLEMCALSARTCRIS